MNCSKYGQSQVRGVEVIGLFLFGNGVAPIHGPAPYRMENAANAMNQAEFSRKYKGYEDRYTGLREKVEKLQEKSEQRKAQADSISAFMFELHETDELVTEFDSKLWISVIDSVVVKHNGKLLFRFRNGMEIGG